MKLSTMQRWISPKRSIQGKIFISFIAVTLVSIVSITVIVYMSMRETIMQNAITSVSDSIRQADESLNMMLEEIDRLNTVVVTNKNTVIDTLLSPNEEISYEWFQEQKRMDEFLSSLIDYKAYISRIAVVGLNGKVFFSGGPWLDRTILGTPVMDYMLQNGSRHAYFKQTGVSDAVTIGREIRYDRAPIGVVMVDVNYEFIQKTYDVRPTTDSMIYVLDKENRFVYETRATASLAPSYEEIKDINQQFGRNGDAVRKYMDGKEYIVLCRQSDYTGWSTIALTPIDSLLTESVRLRKLLAEVSMIVFVVVLIVSLQVSSRITLNIRKLKSLMMFVKDGNFTLPKKEIKSEDETGQLYLVFISMMEELKRLLEGIRLSEKEKREAELTALQAQIHPHFLYNSLNTIKYLARLNGVPNIEEVSGSLIELMRSVLGNSSEFLTLREELAYVEHYVSIMKYRYMKPIRLITEIEDDALLDCRVLKLMLQPLVENAIIHGIGPLEQDGFVLIRVYEDANHLHIDVVDNGKGITEEQQKNSLEGTGTKGETSRFSGMGVRNVHERIVRMYGDSYGVHLCSEPGFYTKAEIRLPKLEKRMENTKREVT
ncbi:helicase Ski2 [Chryseobacterium mucoviscidosis]|uniref:sensor histidine kinase n=1 Tax=unclassified Paenibacillus TaxID=185978 RepID=UPI0009A3350C|nr:sensor histidine kinase [Paenibacillus sp. 11B]MDN8589104.1 sensor histidine kinase [Paenibacillus sp. 11B]OPG99987.1 helicase Ski2 [Chryseobacterium mucoviscidosis]